MIDRLAELIVNEGNWLPFAMTVASGAILASLYRYRELPARMKVTVAMNLFFAITIGVMALGHLLAVSVKLGSGTLQRSVPLLYAIGLALSVPSWVLFFHARNIAATKSAQFKKTMLLNLWLGVTLLALGIHNLPLALPALFNIGYLLHARRSIGWAIVCITVILQLGLFIGGLLFLASGQSFEEFMDVSQEEPAP